MIILHRKPDDPFATEIEERLKDLVVAYKIEEYGDRKSRFKLPYIQEKGTVVTGKEKIKSYLDQLSVELQQQRLVTGDGCYIDPETGEIC